MTKLASTGLLKGSFAFLAPPIAIILALSLANPGCGAPLDPLQLFVLSLIYAPFVPEFYLFALPAWIASTVVLSTKRVSLRIGTTPGRIVTWYFFMLLVIAIVSVAIGIWSCGSKANTVGQATHSNQAQPDLAIVNENDLILGSTVDSSPQASAPDAVLDDEPEEGCVPSPDGFHVFPVLTWNGSDSPIVNRRFRMTLEDGRVITGRTDAQGRTVLVSMPTCQQVAIELLKDDE
ncbi:hypothetical protein [Denitromonas halophila]|uniref:Uncharacterized protein n=1 Tax=Denitromonas halophila TaxID=1629404 RepID=A0A557QYK5_9RHOO|nr:hypothetical protein [Denitromonas halophila]TVO57988.1 hypothetical protein FHP91_06160 [Denitromonas halophila]